jgi:hypothetical protein
MKLKVYLLFQALFISASEKDRTKVTTLECNIQIIRRYEEKSS